MSPVARFLVVQTATRTVGLDLAHVREVVGVGTPWPVPSSAASMLGVVPVRERLVPLVDLGLMLGDRSLERVESDGTMAVLLVLGGRQVALAIREAEAVLRQPLLPRQAGEEMPGLLGLAGADRAIPVLDPGPLLGRILDTEALA